jgi:replicative DNA helicase
MSELIMRAEQGVLAAMLTRTDYDLITNNLEAADFAHPVHQAVYTALRDAETAPYDNLAEHIATVALIVDRPEVDEAWLRQIAGRRPEQDLIGQYTRIVVQAAFDRDVAGFADPYREAAAHTEQDREILTRLADALDAQAAAFGPGSTIDPTIDVRLDVELSVPFDVSHELDREDQIIADILQHPEQATAVAAWLDSAVFTSPQRRLAFELTVSLAYDQDTFDTVTLAWQLQRARDILRYDTPELAAETLREDDYAYLNRLRTATVTAGTAVTIGHQLIHQHIHTTVALSEATTTERAAQAAVTHQHHAGPAPVTQTTTTADIRAIEL